MFSGIGGFELGIKRASESMGRLQQENIEGKHSKNTEKQRGVSYEWECIGYSEIDKYSIQTYEKNFRGHKNYGDATKIKPEELPDFDMLCGGFPCQSFSIAGKRKGFQDTRGTLFHEICRIVAFKKPRLLFLENVKGLLSADNGRCFATIISSLDELGYNVEWQVLNSKNFGVPQNRERVFVIGHLRETSSRQIFPLKKNGEETDKLQRHSTNTLTARYEKAQATGSYIVESKLNAQKENQPVVIALRNLNRNGRLQHSDGYSAAVQTSGNEEGIREGSSIRRLTPTECERLQGFPDGWTEGVSDTQRYKQLGNAVTVNVIEAIARRLIR